MPLIIFSIGNRIFLNTSFEVFRMKNQRAFFFSFSFASNLNLTEIGINKRGWVDSGKDRDYWRAIVNAGLNTRFHKP